MKLLLWEKRASGFACCKFPLCVIAYFQVSCTTDHVSPESLDPLLKNYCLVNICWATLQCVINFNCFQVIQAAIAKLSKEQTTVDEFIEYMVFLREISAQLPNLQIQYKTLSELYFIAKDYDIFLSLEQLALYQTVVRTLQHLQSLVLICEKMKDDNMIKFSEGLGEYMDSLQTEIREYKNKVSCRLIHQEFSNFVTVFSKELYRDLCNASSCYNYSQPTI